MENEVSSLKRQLTQLKELHEAGALAAAPYEESKAKLERRVLDLVLGGAVPTAHPAPSAAQSTSTAAASPVLATPRASRKLLGVLGALVLGVAALGYWQLGSPGYWNVGPSASAGGANAAQQGAGTAASHPTDAEQIAGMVDRLQLRLREQPQDPEGWAMLARSYTVLGRHADALGAYEKAIALRGDDAQLYADYADSLAVKNNRNISGEPMKMVEKALKIDPQNVKALALAGTDAFTRADYALAARHWEKAAQHAPPDSDYAKQIQASLAQARELSGAPKTEPPDAGARTTVAAGPAPTPPVKADAGLSVRGTVSLSAALTGQAAPSDTVFVFARPEQGERMPLAILRKQVKDLPFEFVLDDSLAMSPAAKISGAQSVVLTARISKSGEAMPQSGDLMGQVGPVKVGDGGLKLEIREVVKN